MPFNTVKLRPGINVEMTPLLNEAGYSESQLGRFKNGLFQKIGGWTSSTIYSSNLNGVPKALHAWQDLNENKFLLAGTTTTLTIIEDGVASDKTPQTLITDGAQLSITNGSSIVAVIDSTVSEITSDDTIFFNTPAQIGNIILFGAYAVRSSLGAGNFDFDCGTVATSTTSTEAVPVFDSTINSATITVTLNGHGLNVGDEVDFPIPTIGSISSVTISNASPGVVTWTNNGLVANDAIEFTTTGALPNPLVAGTTYYVKTVLTPNTFTLSSTPGGGVINTTTAGSGTHTAVVNGNVTIDGTYTVTASTTNTFDIVVNSQASATMSWSMNVGLIQLKYYLTIGPQASSAGYGTGTYGSGGYGTGTVPAAQTGTPITTLNWTLDNFGRLGVACPQDGAVYYYDPNGGFQTAQVIPNAPLFNEGIFVAMPQQQIVAYGSSTEIELGYVQDPLLVRWCDVGNFTVWTGTDTNQAGQYRLSTGSLIVGGRQGPQNGLLWTDLDCWEMSYIGGLLVYGFNKVGLNCGLVGQHAHAVQGANVYWMGKSNFYSMEGNGVSVLPCEVWDFVFQDLDPDNMQKSIACSNAIFNEIMFFFPSTSGATGENDKYVKFNTIERSWDYGTLGRSAWTDQSVLGNPIGAQFNGAVYQHELTNNANGQAITSSFKTAYWMLSEGEELVFVDWILPDFKWGTYNGAEDADIRITIYATDYPGQTPQAFGPYSVTKASPYINVRVRARYMAIEVSSSDLDSFWRLGALKYRWGADGRR